MPFDTDTFLVTVYCVVDELYQSELAPALPPRPGPRPHLADSEVLTLAVLAQWFPRRSERGFLRYATTHWRGYFPGLTSQSAFNRRVRNCWPLLARLGPALARALRSAGRDTPAFEAWDGVPVPLARVCRGRRHRLFGAEAGIGHGGADRARYYGVEVWATTDATGLITGFVVGPAGTSEYWLAESLLRWRADPTAPPPTAEDLLAELGPAHRAGGRRQGPGGTIGPRVGAGTPPPVPYVSDLGCTGRQWRQHWRDRYGAIVLTKADYDQLTPPATQQRLRHWLGALRQAVETVFGTLSEHFGLAYPRARGLWGLWTRISAKIAAYNVAVTINYQFGRPPFAIFNPYL